MIFILKRFICRVAVAQRAGWLVIRRSLVQIPAPGRAELHVKVSLSKILNPTLLISEGPAVSWRLIQGVPSPRPETRLGLAATATPRDPMERDKRFGQWHDMTDSLAKKDSGRMSWSFNLQVELICLLSCAVWCYRTHRKWRFHLY